MIYPSGFSVEADSLFMVLRAFAFGLIFGGDSNPDTERFYLVLSHSENLLT